jgi:hypothetical protein
MKIPSRLSIYFAGALIFAGLYFGFTINVAAQSLKQTTLRGQVVCSVCWFEAPDRKKTRYGNAADLKCAADCSELGNPQALAVEDEKGFTLYILEKG